jgi:hypothetical protein
MEYQAEESPSITISREAELKTQDLLVNQEFRKEYRFIRELWVKRRSNSISGRALADRQSRQSLDRTACTLCTVFTVCAPLGTGNVDKDKMPYLAYPVPYQKSDGPYQLLSDILFSRVCLSLHPYVKCVAS